MAISIDKINTSLTESTFSESQKKWITDNFSYFGENTKSLLVKKIYDADFEDIKDILFKSIQDSVSAVESVKKGQADILIQLLHTSIENSDYEFGKFVIPVIVDAKRNPAFNQNYSGQLKDEINKFELRLFQNLPYEELVDVVQHNLLYFIKKLDIVYEFKKLYFIPSLFEQVEWVQPFRPALESNTELLGTKNLKSDNEQFSPTIANWLKDYIIFLPSVLKERGGYGQIKYLQQASNVQTLNDEEKNLLLEVLKLYSWFLDPVVTEEELDAYEKEQRSKSHVTVSPVPPPAPVAPKGFSDVAVKEPVVSSPIQPVGKPPFTRPPVMYGGKTPITPPAPIRPPAPSPIDIQREMEKKKKEAEQIIDRKLDDLKSKASW